MEIPSKKVYEILGRKGVDAIYHANSVITACQFLRGGSLMSRGTVHRKGLYQSPQNSDPSDKQYGVWFDVFTDSVDIHARAKRANIYGPVLFMIDLELIRKTYTGKIWVTRLNPAKWASKSHKERWFVSAEDLERKFVRGCFDQMIVFRHCGGDLPFHEYLKKIVLDDPRLKSKTGIDYYSMAYGALKLAITEGNFHDVRIRKRVCPAECICEKKYKSDREETRQMFIPAV